MLQEQSVVLNAKTRTLYIKIANATANEKTATLNLSRFGIKPNAEMTTLAGQPNDENDYDKQPISPKKEQIKLKKKQTLKVAPYSFVMITAKL